MAEADNSEPKRTIDNKLEVDSHGLVFPIHKKDVDEYSGLANSKENLLIGSIDKSEDENRPESAIYGALPFNFPGDGVEALSSMKLMERLNRRIGRCNPRYAEESGKRLDAITTNVGLQIVVEASALEFLLSNYAELLNEEAEQLVNYSTLKIAAEIEQGIPMNDHWEKEVDELEIRLRQARGRNERSVALFNRHELKELTKAKQQQALEFSSRMQELAKEKALKRKADYNSREFTLVIEARQEFEEGLKKKMDKLTKQHEKAKESLRILQEKKKVRQIDFLQGINRQKKIVLVSPFYVQKEYEFKKIEEDRYFSHGRRQSQVEEFLKQKKTYHLLRNKKNIMELLHPEAVPNDMMSRSPFYNSRLISAQGPQTSSKSQSRRLNLSHDLLMVEEDNIKFAQLPKLKFSK
jgi:hypothetical protein